MKTILSMAMMVALLAAHFCSATAASTTQGSYVHVRYATPEQEAINKQINHLEDLADAALNAGKYALAETYAHKGQSLTPAGDGCLRQLAEALFAQGKDKEALDQYKKIIEDKGRAKTANVLLPYALLLLENGQYPQAVDAYSQAISTYDTLNLASSRCVFSADVPQPKELEVAIYAELGQVWTGWGVWGGNPNYDKALDDYQHALELSPNDALANYYRGDVLKRLGLRAQAQAAYAKAARFGEGDVRKAAQDALAGR